VAVLAGLRQPTSADIEAELPALLQELGTSLPEKREALKLHVDTVAHEIVAGSVTPYAGAARMKSVTFRDVGDEYWDQLAEFYGLAIEYEERNRPASELDPDTVATAQAFLSRGGLRISSD
jgi:hypothetical protein